MDKELQNTGGEAIMNSKLVIVTILFLLTVIILAGRSVYHRGWGDCLQSNREKGWISREVHMEEVGKNLNHYRRTLENYKIVLENLQKSRDNLPEYRLCPVCKGLRVQLDWSSIRTGKLAETPLERRRYSLCTLCRGAGYIRGEK